MCVCGGSKKTNLEIEFGDIKQSFAAGLKALVLSSDPVVFECFNYHLLQHLRAQKAGTHTYNCINKKCNNIKSSSIYSLNT